MSVAAPKALLALDAQYKDEKLPLVSALAFSRGGSAVQLTLSTHELVCKHLREMVERMPGEVSFDLTLAPLLAQDGATSWAMTRARFGAVTRQGNLGAVDVNTFNPSEDVSVTLDHTLLFPPDKLALKGPLLATGCGVLPWTKDATVNPQAELKVALAGKTVPINGATLSAAKDGRTTLRLTSEPHPCGSVVGSDIALTITLDKERATAVRAEGYTLPRTLFKKLDTELSASVEGDDVTMAGQLELGRYRLEIDGKVRAQRCP